MITPDNVHQLIPLQRATRGWISQLAWSPDGRMLACSSAGGVGVWRGSIEGKQAFIKGHDGPVKGVAFAPNGATLATCSADTTVKVWDLQAFSPSMQPVDFYTDFSDAVEKVLIARNGAVIACGVNGTVRIFRAGEAMVLEGHADEVLTIALSPDHRMLASGSRDHTVGLWDTISGELLGILEGHTDWIRVVDFHPTESLLLSASRDRSVRMWDVSDLTTSSVKMAFQHGGDVRAAAIGASGNLLAAGSTDTAIHIWSLVTGERLTTLEAHTMPVVALAFHPNNNLLASGGGDNQVILWGIEA